MSELARLIAQAKAAGLVPAPVHGFISYIVDNMVDFVTLPVGTYIKDKDGDVWLRIDPDSEDHAAAGAENVWQLIVLEGTPSSLTDYRTSDIIMRNWGPVRVVEAP